MVLKEVKKDEIPKVLQLLKKDWPNNFLLHQYITIMEEYKEERKPTNQTLYTYGSIDSGVFILKTSFSDGRVDSQQCFIGTTCSDLLGLSEVLMESSDISFGKGLLFEINFSKFTPHVTQALTSRGLQYEMTTNTLMWLTPESELDVGVVPDNVYLKYLEESQIPEINENWAHRSPGSDLFLAHELKINFGLGLFRKSDNKLLSSSISFHSGGVFVLYTDLEHRKKGYAEIIVRNMAHEIRKRGRTPFGTILVENMASLSLFRKIGFKEFCTVNFIVVM